MRCLITLATPHRGSALATWALSGRGALPRAVRAIGLDALRDLTPEACARRNQTVTDRPDVCYLSVVAARPRAEQPGLLRGLLPEVMEAEGPNDGMVSLASARWGEVVAEARADHFELIGWDVTLPRPWPLADRRRTPFDHLALLRRLVTSTAPPVAEAAPSA